MPIRSIVNVKTTPDIDRNKLTVEVMTDHQMLSDKLEVKVLEGKQLVAVGSSVMVFRLKLLCRLM